MTIQENFIKCLQDCNQSGYLHFYKSESDVKVLQAKEKPAKGFKKVSETELVSLCSKYIHDHQTLNQSEKDAINRVTAQVVGAPKAKGLRKIIHAAKRLISTFKNGLTFRGFHSTHAINVKKAQELANLTKDKKTVGQETPKIEVNLEKENEKKPEVTKNSSDETKNNESLQPVSNPVVPVEQNPKANPETQVKDPTALNSSLTVETQQPVEPNKVEEKNEEESQSAISATTLVDIPSVDNHPIPPFNPYASIGQRAPVDSLRILSLEQSAIEMQKNLEDGIEENIQSLTFKSLPIAYLKEKLDQNLYNKATKWVALANEPINHENFNYDKIPEEIQQQIVEEVRAAYAAKDDLVKNPDGKFKPLIKEHAAISKQGKRAHNEDAHGTFTNGDSFGMITADGHSKDGKSGTHIANYLVEQAKARFPEAIKQANGDFYTTINSLVFEIQKEIINHEALAEVGSTFVLTYITPECIYTATVGDSDTYLVKNKKLFRLSPGRGWAHPEEQKRALEAWDGERNLKEYWEGLNNPKNCYFPKDGHGELNNSRSFGNYQFTYGKDNRPAMIHTPVVTCYKLDESDKGAYILQACDGLFDFSVGPQIINIIENNELKKIPKKLAAAALKEGCSTDNVTVQICKLV